MSFQTKLAFDKVTAHEAAQAREHELSRPLPPVISQAPKRPPGRPPKKRPLTVFAESESDADPSTESPDEPMNKKQKRTLWFSSPYIADIIALYRQTGCARATVRKLKAKDPDGRFMNLRHGTIIAWHGVGKDKFTLLPHFHVQFELNQAATRGIGPPPALAKVPEVEQEIIATLQKMRLVGTSVDIGTTQLVMRAIINLRKPELLDSLKLSKAFVSRWVRNTLSWSWRHKTTAASKLPHDWEDQGVQMAMRLAALMAYHKIDPSLVINLDQTGVNLVPSAGWTYEEKGATSVGVIGGDDKRQITACVASSLDGNMLPLQLIFEGKTPRCLPAATPLSISQKVHLTFSENHWSSQKTMEEWVEHVLMPYAQRRINHATHPLHADSNIALVLDVWSVHKSEAFRRFLRTKYPHIRLVYVPANCTSKLQVADVVLQRPFKQSIKNLFNEWATNLIQRQIENCEAVGLHDQFKMQVVKPKILEWCIESWRGLQERKELVLEGWKRCCTSLYDVKDPEKRMEALRAMAASTLDAYHVPDEDEQDAAGESDFDSDDESDDERDFSIPIPEGKKSGRVTSQPDRLSLGMRQSTGVMLHSSHLAMEASGEEPDSEANGME